MQKENFSPFQSPSLAHFRYFSGKVCLFGKSICISVKHGTTHLKARFGKIRYGRNDRHLQKQPKVRS
jgi:hypothetical protein